MSLPNKFDGISKDLVSLQKKAKELFEFTEKLKAQKSQNEVKNHLKNNP